MQKLTKEQAVKEHREMWMWITKNIVSFVRNGLILGDMKEYYIEKYKSEYKGIHGWCFCCEYVNQTKVSFLRCGNCPIIWKNGFCYTESSEYYKLGEIIYEYHYLKRNNVDINGIWNILEHYERRMVKLAYMIAMLTESLEV